MFLFTIIEISSLHILLSKFLKIKAAAYMSCDPQLLKISLFLPYTSYPEASITGIPSLTFCLTICLTNDLEVMLLDDNRQDMTRQVKAKEMCQLCGFAIHRQKKTDAHGTCHISYAANRTFSHTPLFMLVSRLSPYVSPYIAISIPSIASACLSFD